MTNDLMQEARAVIQKRIDDLIDEVITETAYDEQPNWKSGDRIFLVVRRLLGDLSFTLEANDLKRTYRDLLHDKEPLYRVVVAEGDEKPPTLDEARRLFMGGFRWEQARAAGAAAAEMKEKASKQSSDLLERLARIIETSDHEGEKTAAGSLYEKIAGKPFSRGS